jgi:hypothetical protein
MKDALAKTVGCLLAPHLFFKVHMREITKKYRARSHGIDSQTVNYKFKSLKGCILKKNIAYMRQMW